MSSFPSYQTWTETWIEAPKVQVRRNENSAERGLFCTDIIHPGERILYLPSQVLIGQHVLQQRGFDILQQQQQQQQFKHQEETLLELLPMSDEDQEGFVMGMIEELRRWCVSRNKNDDDGDDDTRHRDDDDNENIVRRIAEQVQYEWREDDAVALYLLACRTILQQSPTTRNMDDAADQPSLLEEPQQVQVDVANENALLVKAVTPIADSDPLVVDAVQVGLSLHQHHNEDETILVPTANAETHQPSSAIVVVVEQTQQQDDHTVSKVQTDSHPSFLPHIQMLPTSYPTIPLFYNADDLARIEGTNCHGFCTRMLQQMESDWQRLQFVLQAYHHDPRRHMSHKHDTIATTNHDKTVDHQSCPCCCLLDPSMYTLDDYKWALCTIYSRSTDFFVDHSDDDGEHHQRHHRVIAPLLDMMNHDFGSDLSHFMDAQGNISVFNGSTRTLLPGDEIFLRYGSFPNEKLLLVYGFCLADNPCDVVQIYAPIRPTDPLYHPKARLLQTRCGIEDVNAPHGLALSHDDAKGGILPPSLLSVLRVVGIQSAEEIMSVATAAMESPEEGIGMISVDNERSALSALGQALHSMARRIALNLISDEGLQGASNSVPTLARKEKLGTIVEKVDVLDTAHHPEQNTHRQAETEKGRDADPRNPTNVHNAKLLCIAEYRILQAALAEISERLTNLDGTSQTMQ